MTAPTHLVIGIAASVTVARISSAELTPLILLVILLGSIAPDIDGDGVVTKPGSMFRKFLPKGIGKFLNILFGALSAFLRSTLGHRGFFHWPALALLIALGGLFFPNTYLLWFSFAYLMHIMADSLTPSGVPLLAPINTKPIHLATIPTGSLKESILFGFVLLYVIVFGWELLPEVTRKAILMNG